MIAEEDFAADLGAGAGDRFGLNTGWSISDDPIKIDRFRVAYESSTEEDAQQTILVVSAGGSVYRDDLTGNLDDIGGDVDLSSDVRIRAVERGQKLYIADRELAVRVRGDDGVVTGTTLDDTGDDLDWSTYGIDKDNDVVVITNGTGSTVDGTYKISAVAAASLTLAAAPGNGNCTFVVQRAPKVFDPSDDSLAIWTATASKGQVPSSCHLIARYNDRLVLADNTGAWYMSRQGDPLDWDYAPTNMNSDYQRAVAGASNDAGLLGVPMTALIAHAGQKLVMGGHTSLWVLRGDPEAGGRIHNLSSTIGVVDGDSWCLGPEGEIIFLSHDGIYVLAPGVDAYPQSVSREALPQELRGVDTELYKISMAYSVRHRGVFIFVSPFDAIGGEGHFFLDWQTKSLWPDVLQTNHEPFVAYVHGSQSPDDSGLLIGGRDGYIRRFRDANVQDDGSAIASDILYGPIRLGGNDMREGLLQQIQAVLGDDSGDVTWSVLVGASAEAAWDASAFATGTFTAGFNAAPRPRARGMAFYLKLAATTPWAVERVTATLQQLGIKRVW